MAGFQLNITHSMIDAEVAVGEGHPAAAQQRRVEQDAQHRADAEHRRAWERSVADPLIAAVRPGTGVQSGDHGWAREVTVLPALPVEVTEQTGFRHRGEP